MFVADCSFRATKCNFLPSSCCYSKRKVTSEVSLQIPRDARRLSWSYKRATCCVVHSDPTGATEGPTIYPTSPPPVFTHLSRRGGTMWQVRFLASIRDPPVWVNIAPYWHFHRVIKKEPYYCWVVFPQVARRYSFLSFPKRLSYYWELLWLLPEKNPQFSLGLTPINLFNGSYTNMFFNLLTLSRRRDQQDQ